MNKTDDQLRSDIETNEFRAEWSAWGVFAGLILEVLFALAKSLNFEIKPKAENWGAVVADCLIALGVAGEVLFSRKARIASDELTRRSEQKVAEANARAQEAALELERFKAPRFLSEEQIVRVSGQLRQFAGTQYNVAVSSFDREYITLVMLLETTLHMAGWEQIDWQGYGVTRGAGRPTMGRDVPVTDVIVGMSRSHQQMLTPAALALARALSEEGIKAYAALPSAFGHVVPDSNGIHVMIGRKT